jgi:hypothetical protein
MLQVLHGASIRRCNRVRRAGPLLAPPRTHAKSNRLCPQGAKHKRKMIHIINYDFQCSRLPKGAMRYSLGRRKSRPTCPRCDPHTLHCMPALFPCRIITSPRNCRSPHQNARVHCKQRGGAVADGVRSGKCFAPVSSCAVRTLLLIILTQMHAALPIQQQPFVILAPSLRLAALYALCIHIGVSAIKWTNFALQIRPQLFGCEGAGNCRPTQEAGQDASGEIGSGRGARVQRIWALQPRDASR